jgi:hypothetical protein
VHSNVNFVLEVTHAEIRIYHCVYSKEKELEPISSLNILYYIEFYIPYNLNCLEKRLSQESGLHCLSVVFLCI